MTISKYSRIYYHYRAIAAACKELLATRKADDPRNLLDFYQDELGEELPRMVIEDACVAHGVPTTLEAK